MMRTHTITMIACKDNYRILPQILFINCIDNLTNLGIHLFHQPEVKAAITPPIIRRIMTGGISRIVQCLFIIYYIGIIRITGKI